MNNVNGLSLIQNSFSETAKGNLQMISNCNDVEGILGSKYSSLYFHFLEEIYKNTIKDKIGIKLKENHYQSDKSLWEEIYTEIFLSKNKNERIPSMVYKYILLKAKDKISYLKNQVQKTHKNIDQIYSYYTRNCHKVRNKLIERKKQEGIEIEESHLFHQYETKSKLITSWSKKLKFDFNKQNANKKVNFLQIFSVNKELHGHGLDESSDDNESNKEMIKLQIEKIKKRIKLNEPKFEKEKKDKKFNHIKSRFLQTENFNLATEPSPIMKPLITTRTKRQINFSAQSTPHYTDTKFNYFTNNLKNSTSRDLSNDKKMIKLTKNKVNLETKADMAVIRKILFTSPNNKDDLVSKSLNFNYNLKMWSKKEKNGSKLFLSQTELPELINFDRTHFSLNKKSKNTKQSIQFFKKTDFYYN